MLALIPAFFVHFYSSCVHVYGISLSTAFVALKCGHFFGGSKIFKAVGCASWLIGPLSAYIAWEPCVPCIYMCKSQVVGTHLDCNLTNISGTRSILPGNPRYESHGQRPPWDCLRSEYVASMKTRLLTMPTRIRYTLQIRAM